MNFKDLFTKKNKEKDLKDSINSKTLEEILDDEIISYEIETLNDNSEERIFYLEDINKKRQIEILIKENNFFLKNNEELKEISKEEAIEIIKKENERIEDIAIFNSDYNFNDFFNIYKFFIEFCTNLPIEIIIEKKNEKNIAFKINLIKENEDKKEKEKENLCELISFGKNIIDNKEVSIFLLNPNPKENFGFINEKTAIISIIDILLNKVLNIEGNFNKINIPKDYKFTDLVKNYTELFSIAKRLTKFGNFSISIANRENENFGNLLIIFSNASSIHFSFKKEYNNNFRKWEKTVYDIDDNIRVDNDPDFNLLIDSLNVFFNDDRGIRDFEKFFKK